jgi:hypothetical protein
VIRSPEQAGADLRVGDEEHVVRVRSWRRWHKQLRESDLLHLLLAYDTAVLVILDDLDRWCSVHGDHERRMH